MRILSYEMPKNWNYFLFGDTHVGARLRHEKGFAKMVDMINSPYDGLPADRNFALDHGDMMEAITIDDPRYNVFDSREGCIFAQRNTAIKERYPIQDKLVAILDGNHEFKLHRFGKLTHSVCKELGVSFGTSSCKIAFKRKGKLQFKHFAAHGWGSISSIADDPERRKLNWRLSLKRKLREKCSDAILMSMGHTHRLIVSPATRSLYLTDDGTNINHNITGSHENLEYIHPDFRWYVNTGSFLKLYGQNLVENDDVDMENSKLGSGYAERAGYDPTDLGFCVVKIRKGKIKEVVTELI